MTAKLLTVHVRVNDAATGQPTPARVRFASPEGHYYPPLGYLADFPTGPNEDVGGHVLLDAKQYAYIPGSCEIPLPAGPLVVEISKGPEYRPVVQKIGLKPGQMTLRFVLERWIDLRLERWYSGDSRAHFLSPQAALLEGAAEDLAVVNLLACETDITCVEPRGTNGDEQPVKTRQYISTPNLLAFSGQKPLLQIPGQTKVVVNTHNRHAALGSLGLLNCHRVVFPLRFGAPHGKDHWALADWCDQCHRKDGLVVWTDRLEEPADYHYCEALANLILGRIDAVEKPFSRKNWHGFLNCGFHVPLVGGSGKDSNRIALGSVRTYARLQPREEFTYGHWIEAVRAGRTFVTTGPLLLCTVNGQDPGSVVDVPRPGATVRVQAGVRSLTSVEWLEVVANGRVVATTQADGPSSTPQLVADVPLGASGWIGARCWGQHLGQLRVLAQTSPIYVNVAGQPPQPDPEVLNELIGRLDKGLTWIKYEARCDTEHAREKLSAIVESARAELVRLLGEGRDER